MNPQTAQRHVPWLALCLVLLTIGSFFWKTNLEWTGFEEVLQRFSTADLSNSEIRRHERALLIVSGVLLLFSTFGGLHPASRWLRRVGTAIGSIVLLGWWACDFFSIPHRPVFVMPGVISVLVSLNLMVWMTPGFKSSQALESRATLLRAFLTSAITGCALELLFVLMSGTFAALAWWSSSPLTPVAGGFIAVWNRIRVLSLSRQSRVLKFFALIPLDVLVIALLSSQTPADPSWSWMQHLPLLGFSVICAGIFAGSRFMRGRNQSDRAQAVEHSPGESPSQHEQSHRELLVFVSQSLVVEGYRSFYEHVAQLAPEKQILLVSPAQFRELGGQIIASPPLRRSAPRNLNLLRLKSLSLHAQIMIPLGIFNLFWRLRSHKGSLHFIILAEPYSISFLWIWFCLVLSRLHHCRTWCYTAQNIYKNFPWALHLIQRIAFSACEGILAVGSEQEEVLRRQGYAGHAIPFPLWYDEMRFHLGPHKAAQNAALRVGYCGKIGSEKGIFDFTAALRSHHKFLLPGCTICVAGGGPAREQLETELAELQEIGYKIEDHGAISFDEVPEFFRSLDVLVVPSHTLPNWKEQFGRVIIEALACGVTVIGSDSGEIPHVIAVQSRIFPEKDPQALGDCLVRNLPVTDEVRRENHERAFKRYSSQATAQDFLQKLARAF